MANLNRVILVGRLATEVDLKYTTEGTALAKFRLAVDRQSKSSSGPKADFFNIVAWNKLAEICSEYLKKGGLVLIEGRIQQRTYETDNNIKKYITEIVVQNMRMLEKLANKNFKDEEASDLDLSDDSATNTEVADGAESFYTEDDIPF